MINYTIRWLSRLSAILVFGVFIWLIFDILTTGFSGLSLNFIIAEPEFSGRSGGIFPILVSTGFILGICLLVAVPIGFGAAVYLNECVAKANPAAHSIQKCVDVLAGMPSIVFGLFGNALFSKILGMGFSILSGGLTLACMILPFLVRTLQLGLNEIPKNIRLTSHSLGLTNISVITRVLLPTCLPSLFIGIVLGIARALSETAALLFTAGYVDRLPESILDSGRALSIHIYDLAMNVPGGNQNAYTSALVLLIALLFINSITIGIGQWISKKVSY